MNDDLTTMTTAELLAERHRLRTYRAVLATRQAKIGEILTQRRLGEPEPIGVTTDDNGTITADPFAPAAGQEAVALIAERIQSFTEARGELSDILDEHGVTDDDTDS